MSYARPVRVVARVAIPIGLAACGPESASRTCSDVMIDSVGAEYPTAEHDRLCMPGVGEDTPTGTRPDGTCGGDDAPSVIFSWGRFYEACPACGHGTLSTLCRPLTCDIDGDCPRFENMRLGDDGERETFIEEFECRNGLCQSADLDEHPPEIVYAHEAFLLCNAMIERHEPYDGPEPCPGGEETCPLPLPDACLQP